ncbi:MAG: glycosyltransferase family 4 protein [Candidatus Binatia bacterium]|nr:glycosyltransferase family 4 protein [Candidatus Binatia bacterium]
MGRPLLILNERDLGHPWAGGAELHIAQMAKWFVRRGYEPTLFCTWYRGAAQEEVTDYGLRIVRFGNRLTYYLQLPAKVRKESRRGGTVILEHLNKIPFCTPLYTDVPVLLITHHLFGWTAFRQVSPPVAAAVVGLERLIPWVYRGRRFVAVSPSTRDDLIARGIAAESIHVIPNGLDHVLYNPNGRCPDVQPTVLVLGRVEFYKRIDLVLRAAAKLRQMLPDLHVVVVGDGRAQAHLQKLAAELSLERCTTFTGFVPDAVKVDYIRRCHVVVNTSEKEGWGLTVLEANACGVPAIASDVPGLRDAVRHGETGLLVPHGDLQALVDAMARILTDTSLRERLSRGAIAWAKQFSWEQAADRTIEVIEAEVARR